MNSQRGISAKPLAVALAIALGASGMSANADTGGNPAFAAKLQQFRQVTTQARTKFQQYLAQHPGKLTLMPNAHPHAYKQPSLHPAPAAPASTLSVTSCVDDASSATTSGTLRYAVLNAAPGDSIDLSACNNSTITLTQGALPVAVDGLTVTAGAGNHVTIDGGGADRVFYVGASGSGSLALKYLTVTNGVAPVNTSSHSANGGCIYAHDEGVALQNSTVTGCKAAYASGNAKGGGLAAPALAMANSTISGNTTTAGDGTAMNSGYAFGGGAFVKYQTISIGSHITNNTAQSKSSSIASGGGLWAANPLLIYSDITNNHVQVSVGSATTGYAGVGGGVAAKYGGTLAYSTISGNSVVCSSTATGLNAVCIGGGVVGGYLPGSPGNPGNNLPTLNIYASTISTNHADFFSGGIFSKYQLNLAQSTVTGNSAAVAGGGLTQKYTGGYGAKIYNSTIAANNATYAGGGIFDYPSTPLGGGTKLPAPITLVSSIVAKNASYNGAADDIYLPAGYTPPPSANSPAAVYTLTISGSNDLVMAATSNITLPGGTLSADPLLGPLANNGGSTKTMGLYAGSPALNAGSNPKNYPNDQRGDGFPRVVGAAPDIGAFEGTVAAAAPPVPAPALSVWTMAMLAGLLGLFGWRRRSAD